MLNNINHDLFIDTLRTTNYINGVNTPATMGLGMELRSRLSSYPDVLRSASVHSETDNISTTERSIGMPTNSGQNIYSLVTGTAGIALQISSSDTEDVGVTGAGCRTLYIQGVYIKDGEWYERTSVGVTLDGTNPVQIGSETDWYGVNKIWCTRFGSTKVNAGDLYVAPLGTTSIAGVPSENICQAVIAGYSVSSGGYYFIPSGTIFHYVIGNFYNDESKAINIHEFFYQDILEQSGDIDDMGKYEVGRYSTLSKSYDYRGAAGYTGKSIVALTCFTSTGAADNLTYYVEYCLTKASNYDEIQKNK